MQPKKSIAATDNDIRHILGPSDDELISAVRNTGATREEVLQAFQWLEGEDPGKTARKPMTATIRSVYDILVEDQDSQAPDER